MSGTAVRLLPTKLPREIGLLLGREREIATIIYALEAATAVEVAGSLGATLSNSAIRSMLNRLVAKGILKRALENRTFIYSPALSHGDSRTLALKRFADDHFEGCLDSAAATMRQLIRADTEQTFAPAEPSAGGRSMSANG